MGKIIQAILLGIVQGVTEFLPISSSAHLRVVNWLFNWEEISASFDLALHIGTIIAICIYFFKDGINLIRSGLACLVLKVAKNSKLSIDDDTKVSGSIFWYIIAATIPAGIVSLLLDKVSDKIEAISDKSGLICIAIASSFILYRQEMQGKQII